jgi:hypothetical protein
MTKALEIPAENRIAEAIAAGAFKGCPAKRAGRFDDHSCVPSRWCLAFRIVGSGSFALG